MSVHNLFLFFCLILLGALYSGIALLYSGSVRKKYALAPLVQSLFILSSVFLGWELVYKRLVFTESYQAIGLIGNWNGPFNMKVLVDRSLFSIFHAFFCAIGTLLVMGAALERLRLKAAMILSIFWPLLIYSPIAYWVWNPDGVFHKLGAVDFAGGIVVHISSGISALILARASGRRKDYFNYRPRSDQRILFLGLIFLTFGWLGFNAGSALEWSELSKHALKVTWLTSMAAVFSGVLIEYIHTPHRASLGQIGQSLITGLVMVTPAAGVIDSNGAIVLGLAAGPIIYYGHKIFHHIFKIDDGLDVFLTHALAGFIGAIVTGCLVSEVALKANLIAGVAVIIYSALIMKLVLYLCTKMNIDVAVHVDNLDTTDHGEKSFDFDG